MDWLPNPQRRLIDEGLDWMVNANTPTQIDIERQYAVKYNQQVWDLLGKVDRTEQEDAQMLHGAHCSYRYWLSAGNELNQQRAAWLLARVYSEVDEGRPALHFAQECQRLTRENHELMQDFDLAYAAESLARSNAILHNLAEAQEYYRQALALAEQVTNSEDRILLLADLAGGAWGGLKISA